MTQLNSLTPSSTLALFETNKAQRNNFVQELINQMEDGFSSPLDIQMNIKCLEDIVEQLKKDSRYKQLVMDEAYKNGHKFNYRNSEMAIQEMGVKYDYSQCNDSVMDDILKREDIIKKEKDERIKFLKTIPIEGVVNPSTGEMIYPPTKSSTTTLVVKLK
jgi:hypothetical protein